MDSKGFIDQHWQSLSQYKWRWEFVRRSQAFKKDTAQWLDLGLSQRHEFVDIWDLPHPGNECEIEYTYLPGFRVLLVRILDRFLYECAKTEQIAKDDILRFARALGGDGFYYDGKHSLVSINLCGGKAISGEYIREEIYYECEIRLTAALRERHSAIVEGIKNRFPLLDWELKPSKASKHHWLQLRIAGCFDESQSYEEELAKLTRDTINNGLKPVIPWQRKRTEKYRYQLSALDVAAGAKKKEELLNVYSHYEKGIPEAIFKNHLKLGRGKIKHLEGLADARRSYLVD